MEIPVNEDTETKYRIFGIPIFSKTITITNDFNPEEHIKKMKAEIAAEIKAEIKKGLNIR